MTVPKPPNDTAELLVDGAKRLGLSLADSATSTLIHYMDFLKKWNSRINLTALTHDRDIAILHFLDSLTVFKVLPYGVPMQILDVGTGGGFPGMVLKIVDSSKSLFLLDKSSKKIVFLKQLADRLGLSGIHYLNTDYRDVIASNTRYEFDATTARGFSSDPEVLDELSKILAPSGSLIRMTGPGFKGEICDLHFFELSDIWEGRLPYSEHYRRVIRYKKLSDGSTV